jgi:pentatricopeptide repeat protein
MFDRMRERNMRSWYSLINAHAANGQGVDGLLFVEEMKKGYGCSPSRRLSLAVFMTCACAGAV